MGWPTCLRCARARCPSIDKECGASPVADAPSPCQKNVSRRFGQLEKELGNGVVVSDQLLMGGHHHNGYSCYFLNDAFDISAPEARAMRIWSGRARRGC